MEQEEREKQIRQVQRQQVQRVDTSTALQELGMSGPTSGVTSRLTSGITTTNVQGSEVQSQAS